MISPRLIEAAQCPDCAGTLTLAGECARCAGCGRSFDARGGVLDLRPLATFAAQTKYLDPALHADARHESIAPPLLGSRIRSDQLRSWLRPAAGDRIVDLGCGSGRTLMWHAGSGAEMVGVDVSRFFAHEAIASLDLIVGDLRRLPLRSGTFTKAWSLDVLEHLTPGDLRAMLGEAHRVLRDDGALFVYTHVRQNGWIAGGTRLVNRFARWCERAGLIDLRQERLRKSDHLNPIANHEELRQIVRETGFRLERIVYYTPIVGAFVENVLVRMAERVMVRRAGGVPPAPGSPPSGPGGPKTGPPYVQADDAAARARASARTRLAQRGPAYYALSLLTVAMKLDLLLFGRIQSGPFFALLRKAPATRG
jgi:SAM-dependent methyltransferase